MDYSVFRMFPILIISTMKLSYVILNAYLSGASSLSFICIIVLAKVQLSPKNIYQCGLISLVAVIPELWFLYCTYYNGTSYIFSIPLLTVTFTMEIIFLLSEKIFTPVVCAKLTQSKNQGYVEGLRIFILNLGRLSGSLLTGICFTHLLEFCLTGIVLTFILLIVMIRRRTMLSDPYPVI